MIQNPIFIIGCPRSGTSLVYNLLADVPDLWSIGYESKEIIEKYHHPSVKNWISGALDSDDVTEVSKNYIISQFKIQAASGKFWGSVNQVRNLLRKTRILSYIKTRGKSNSPGAEFSSLLPQRAMNLMRSYVKIRNTLIPSLMPEKIHLLEKTPENCLRLSFLMEIFPDARIIFLVRDGRTNIYSLMEGWQQPHLFPGYKVPECIRIPGYTRGRWAFVLIPGWRDLLDRPLEEVCAWQWYRSNQAVIDFLEGNGNGIPFLQISYEDLIIDTGHTMGKIAEFLEMPVRKIIPDNKLPYINVVSKPDFSKWLKKQDEIERVFPIIKPLMKRMGYL
jgi:hypothetical protein